MAEIADASPKLVIEAETEENLKDDALAKEGDPEKLARDYAAICKTDDFSELARIFTQLGGKFVTAPAQEVVEKSIEDGPCCFRVGVYATDYIVPVCHEGMNRSQILYLVLLAIKKNIFNLTEDKCGILPSHGSESGFDPHRGFKDLNEANVFEFIHGVLLPKEEESEWVHRVFYDAFGKDKCKRLGQLACEFAGLQLNPTDYTPADFRRVERDRLAMREWFDKAIYGHRPASGRYIFACFARGLPNVMSRFVEVAYKRELSLDGVILIGMPFGDPITQAGSREDIARHGNRYTRDQLSRMAHTRFFKMLRKMFVAVCSGIPPVPSPVVPQRPPIPRSAMHGKWPWGTFVPDAIRRSSAPRVQIPANRETNKSELEVGLAAGPADSGEQAAFSEQRVPKSARVAGVFETKINDLAGSDPERARALTARVVRAFRADVYLQALAANSSRIPAAVEAVLASLGL